MKHTSSGQRPVIAIFFNDAQYDEYPFDDPEFRRAYHELAAMIRARGMDAVIVRSMETYLGGNDFSGGWKFDGDTFIREEARVSSTVIFNRGNFIPRGHARVMNHPDLDHLCTDKMETWKRFSSLSPKSVLVHDAAEASRALELLRGDMLVAKPVSLERGIGVFIGKREEVLKKIPSYPYLLQEFIDTSGGIPGIVSGLHDLRVIIAAGVPVLAYYREPKAGSYVANFALGGTLTYLSLERLPVEAMTIVRTVDEGLRMFPGRLYSVDVGRTREGRWLLIEINSKPGVEVLDACPDSPRYLSAIADLLTGTS